MQFVQNARLWNQFWNRLAAHRLPDPLIRLRPVEPLDVDLRRRGPLVAHRVQSVVTEFLLNGPDVRDFVVARLEDRAVLTEKSKAAKLKSLDDQIATVTGALRKAMVAEAKAKAEAEVRALEEQFSGAAA